MAPKNSMFSGMPQKLPRVIAERVIAERPTALRVKSQKFRTKVP